MSLGRTAYFDLAIFSAPLLGVVVDVASPPVNFIPALWQGWNIPISFFLQGVYQTPWPFGKTLRSLFQSWEFHFWFFEVLHFPDKARKLSESFPPFFRQRFDVWFLWLISHVQSRNLPSYSVLEVPLEAVVMSPTFFEEALKWSANFSQLLPHELGWFVPSDILWGIWSCLRVLHPWVYTSALIVGYSAVRLLVWRRLFQALDSKILPDSWSFLKLLEGLLRDYERCPGNSDSCLLLFLSWNKECLIRLLPFSPTVFFM